MRESVVHLSLNRKASIMGVDAAIFGLEAALLGIFVSLQIWPFIALIPLVHALARWAYSRDERLIAAAMKYAREGDLWDPWHHTELTEKRPEGFGKGLPL
ncbi:MAG: VirB3 family type IV secretion system protein [Longimicrobiales bacterium]